MRLVHLADLHLGFRQFQRLTPTGINQREADVAGAFRRAIDQTIAVRPDVVLIAGDVFHNVRPTNPSILHAFSQFTRLARELPDATIVLVAGNHDTPRSAETGCILRLFSPLGIHVVDSDAKRLSFPERDLSILAVPDAPGGRPALTPDPSARWNVLLMHGEVEGMPRAGGMPAERAAVEVSREELGAASWSYVALGHYHVYQQIAPNAFYAGSIDYTSTNPWEELVEERSSGLPGKGFIEHDLETGEHRFHHVAPSRPYVDLPPLSARGLTVAEVDQAIRGAVEACPGGIDDRIVRLLVRDIPRHIARELDHRALRDYKRRALHFHLDTRRPEIIRTHASGAPSRRPTITDIVRDQLRSRLLESDIDRETLLTLGLEYLRQAETADAASGAPVESA